MALSQPGRHWTTTRLVVSIYDNEDGNGSSKSNGSGSEAAVATEAVKQESF